MEKLVMDCQNAFIKRRFIMDGILSLYEVLHEAKRKKQQGLILKLDLEKAYDKMSLRFLFECLEQKGFFQRWCTWLRCIMTGGTLSVKFNDEVGINFGSYKCVRQGDPMSPFLFNVIANGLSRMIYMA